MILIHITVTGPAISLIFSFIIPYISMLLNYTLVRKFAADVCEISIGEDQSQDLSGHVARKVMDHRHKRVTFSYFLFAAPALYLSSFVHFIKSRIKLN